MSAHRATPTPTGRLQGGLVWLLAVLVFALGLLSVSPQAHASLHGHASDSHHAPLPTGHDDGGCAVTLFQHGVTTPLDLPRISMPRDTWSATLTPPRVTTAPSAPDHLLRPARGPPRIG